MDLELGLKITKTRDDIASISEYRLAKAGPIFESTETNTMFILTAHLKGYKRNNINIKISEDGSKISISGEKPVQNILMMGWLMHKKEVDIAGFHKVFKIPDRVKLDGIKAKYEEEEWTMNIFMPKLVKGICGVRIEEINEESERRRSELEKSEADQVHSDVGETSQRGSKESEDQAMEDRESFMEKKEEGVSDKMLDDANREIIKEKIQKYVEESKLGTEGKNGESSGEKGGMEGYEGMKTSELEPNVGGGTLQKFGDTSQKEIEESELRIGDEGVKGTREEVGNTAYEAVKTSRKEKSVGEGWPLNIGDTSQEFEVQEVEEDNGGFGEKEEKVVTEKMLGDSNGNIIREVIQKEKEESKSGIEDGDGSVKKKIGKAGYKVMETSEIEQNVSANVTRDIGDTGQRIPKASVEKMEREKSGEMLVEANVSTEGETLVDSKHKQFGEPKPETEVKESSMELLETMKAPKNVDDNIPSNIGSTSHEEFKKSRIQQKEKNESREENMDRDSKDTQKHIFGGSIQKDIKMPKIETENGEQEYDAEKAGKEEFDSMITAREEFPNQLPKTTAEEKKVLGLSEMQEADHVKEAKIKRKLKDIEYFVDKDEDEEPRRMHMEAKQDLRKETMQESEVAKKETVKRKGKETECFVDKGEVEEPKRIHMEMKKDLTEETMQESEYVKEAMVKGEGREIEGFVGKGEVEEPKMKHMEANKDIAKETMQESEDVKKEMVKRKGTEINYILDEGEGEEPNMMNMETKKDMTKETVQENKDLKEAMVQREGKEIENFADKGEGEEPKRMHMKTKKDLTKEAIMQECEDVKEAMEKMKQKEIEYFVDKGEGEEPKRMHMKEKKDLTTEKMHQTGDVKEVMVKTKHREIENFGDKCEGKEPTRKQMEAKKDSKKVKIQESEDLKEAMIKRKGEETEYVVDNGEEPKIMHMEEKDLIGKTVQESEDVKEAMVTREGKKVTDYFSDQGEDEKPNRMHIEAKRDLTKETMQESEEIKEAMIKRKGKETECFGAGKGESTEPIRMQTKVKDLTAETSEDVREAMVNREGKEINGEEPKMLPMEAKKDLTIETTRESENVKEAMVKREGKEINYFLDEGEGDQEPNKMLREAKKDLTTETMQESDVKEEIVKRKGKETECLVVHGEGKNPKRIHMEVKKDLTKEAMQENEYVKEEMVKRKGKEIDYFVDKGESEELRRAHVEAKKDITKETMQEEIEELKNGIEVPTEEFPKLVGGQDGSRGLKVANTAEQKDMIKEAMAEAKSLKEKVKGEKSKKTEEEGRVIKNNTATEILQKEIEDSNIKTTKSRDAPYVQDNMVNEELRRAHVEAKKDITKETMQEEIEEPKNGIEVPTEEFPKLVGGQDRSRGLKVANTEEQKDMIKEAMAEAKSLKEKFKGEKSKKTEEEGRVIKNNTATEILQKEIEDSHIETTKSRDAPYVQDNMVKVVFEVLGTFQAKLPKHVMEAIAQNKKDKNEYVIVKFKGDGSMKMHVEPNEAFDEDEIEERTEKEIRKSKLKSSDQISGKENVHVGVFDESKRPKFPEKAEKKDVKEHSAKIKESVKKANEDKYEKIQVEQKGDLRKDNAGEHTQTKREGSKIQTMEKDQHSLQGNMSKGRFEASTTAKEEFPMKTVDSLSDKREGLKGTNIDEAKVAKQELVKLKGEEKKSDVKEKGAEIEQLVKKVKEKCEKIQIEAKEGLRKDIHITKGKDQQCLQEGTSKGRYEASTTTREFPMQIVDSPTKTREITKDKEMEKLAKRKSEETNFFESTIEENIQVPESGRISVTFKEILEDKHPKVLEIGPPERELQSTKGPTTSAKVVGVGFKEVEQMSAKHKTHKTKQLPPKIQSKGTYESIKGVKQDTIKPKKEKEVEGEQCTYNIERSKEVARFPSTKQTKVEEKDNLYGGKTEAFIESQKGDPTKDMKSIIEMKDHKESQQRKSLKPEIPQEKHLKKGEPITRKDESSKGQKVMETMQEEIEGHKDKIVDRSEIDEPQVNQQPSPFIEMRSKEPRELEKHGMKEDDSKADTLVHMREGKKHVQSIEGKSTTASEVVADEVAEPSNFSSSSSTQPFEVEGKYKIDANCDEESQESTKDETDEEVEQRETLQPESPEDQQCINKDRIESPVTHEIEEEKTSELADKAGQEDSQLLEEQKECEEEATGGKKNNQKRSKKLFVSMIIAGSALLASGIFLFIRHRRARKGGK